MIRTVQKLAEGRYILNDGVVVSNFEFTDKGVAYKIDYDENVVTRDEATDLADEFIERAIRNSENLENE